MTPVELLANNRTLSVAQAARVVGISRARMYELVKIKGFPCIQIGRRLLVSTKGLERWLDEKAQAGWCCDPDF